MVPSAMEKEKSAAQLSVHDGAGGTRAVVDLRFEAGPWPIELVVVAKDATEWMAHLHAELEDRQWGWNGLGQLGSEGNSGSITIHTAGGPSPPSIEVVWEKDRNDDLLIKARPSGTPVLAIGVAKEFISSIYERQRARKTRQAHRSIFLTYVGHPWRGELWLDNNHRLGPSSQAPGQWSGQQIVRADVLVEGIGNHGVSTAFQRRIHELCVFLSVVLGQWITTSRVSYGWVPDIDAQGAVTGSTVRLVGYAETPTTQPFPQPSAAPPVPTIDIPRPGIGGWGIGQTIQEQWVPSDIQDLWARYLVRLPLPKRDLFLQAGNAYLTALSMRGQQTTYAAFLVLACEALKPQGKRFDRLNIYDVVASLIGQERAAYLRSIYPHPQKIRSDHFHRGKLSARELLPMFMHDYFADPSFDLMVMDLSVTCRICLIEWLRKLGTYDVVKMRREGHSGAWALKERSRDLWGRFGGLLGKG
jgi:hypothetical protein